MAVLDEKAIQGIVEDAKEKWNGSLIVALAAFHYSDNQVIDAGGRNGTLPVWANTQMLKDQEHYILSLNPENQVSITTQEQGATTNQTEPATQTDGGNSGNSEPVVNAPSNEVTEQGNSENSQPSAPVEANQGEQGANNNVSQPGNESANQTAGQTESGSETTQTQESGNSETAETTEEQTQEKQEEKTENSESGKTEEVAPVAADLTDDDFYQILKNHKPLERHIKEDLAVWMYGVKAIGIEGDKKEFADFVDLSLVSKNQGLFTKWVNSSLPLLIGNYKGE